MKQNAIMTTGICVLIILLMAFISSAYYLYRVTMQNIEDAHTIVTELSTYTVSYIRKSGPTNNTSRYNLRLLLVQNPSLKSYITYDKNSSILYAYARNPRYIDIPKFPTVQRSQLVMTSAGPFEIHITRPTIPSENFTAEAVFDVFPYEPAFITVKLLFLLMILLLTIIIIVLIFSRKSPVPQKSLESVTAAEHTGSRIDEDEYGRLHDEKIHTPDSLLCFEEYFSERLDNELRRSASFDQDLTLALLRCKGGCDRQKYIQLSQIVREYFPFNDLLFEYNTDIIAVILPNSDIEEAISHLSRFQKELSQAITENDLDLFSGLSSRNGRLISHDRITSEALAALKKAEKTDNTRIVGFRPDPGKYRSFVASHQS